MKFKFFLSLSLFLLLGCSEAPSRVDNVSKGEAQPTSQASMEAKQVAAEHETPYVAEVQFKKGSYKLSKTEQNKITKLLRKAKSQRKIGEIQILSWADQELPKDAKDSLPEEQTKLAEKRAEAIRDALKNQKSDLQFSLHNMAQKSSALQKLTSSADSEFKKSFESGEAKDQKISKAVIMVLLKDAAE